MPIATVSGSTVTWSGTKLTGYDGVERLYMTRPTQQVKQNSNELEGHRPEITTKKGRRSTKRNAFLLIAVLAMALMLLRPEWLARMLAVAASFLLTNFFFFRFALDPRSRALGPGAMIAKGASESKKRTIDLTIRAVWLASAIFFLWFATRIILYDMLRVAQLGRGYLVQEEGTVTDNQIFFGTFFLHQGLYIRDAEGGGSSRSALFFSRLARKGQTYTFLVAPKSGVILEWNLKGKGVGKQY